MTTDLLPAPVADALTPRRMLSILTAADYAYVMCAAATVGRGSELAEIDAFLRGRDDGLTLAIQGEPGIGKTTLWQETVDRAAAAGIRVLACRPAAAEAKMSFAGLADMLSGIGPAELDALPELQRHALEVALLRCAPTGPAFDARLLGTGLLSLLRVLADARPVLLAVDDAQWLDEPTRRGLVFAGRRLAAGRIGLVWAFRPHPQARELLQSSVAERIRHIRLGPLAPDPMRQMIGNRLGRTLPRHVARRIATAARGNPFYALEVARLLPPDGVADERLPVPDDVRSLAASRVRALPAPTRSALLLAAVLAIPRSQLVDMEALAAGEDAGLVRVDERGRIEFTHPLFASAIYAGATVAQRRAAHRAAAELVADPEQRARHLAYGAPRLDPAAAAELEAASGIARSRGSPAAAAELMELARQMTEAQSCEDRPRRTLAAAVMRMDARDFARAGGLLDDLLAAPAPGLVRARGLRLRAVLESQTDGFSRALQTVLQGIDAAAGQPGLQAALDLDAAFYLVGLGDIGSGLRHAESAVGRAELARGSTGTLGDALAVVTMVGFLSGEGLSPQRLERALALEDPDRERFIVTSPRYIAGLLALWTGDLRQAVLTLTQLRAERMERGIEGDIVAFSLYLVWAHLWLGETERAAAVATDDTATMLLLGDRGLGALLTLSANALVAAHQGDIDTAREQAAAALERMDALNYRAGVVWPRWALGFAELSAGDPAAAHAAMEPLAAMLPAMGLADPIGLVFLPDEIEALIMLGDLDRANGLIELLGRLARVHDRAWALAAAARGGGMLAAARGDLDGGIEKFQAALAEHDRVEMPFERARTLLALGRALRRRKRWGASRDALRDALTVFEHTGASLWAAAARTELARGGDGAADSSQLTATERRVAELTASGLSNQEVAERAYLTVKSVEANLTRVYRKLGIRSRTALARALAPEEDSLTAG